MSAVDVETNATVSGFVEYGGKRLEFVDGLIDFGTEPLEWERYSIHCILSHDHFSEEQLATIRKRGWLDLNHQSVPDGFPEIHSLSGLPFSPSASVSFGEWKVSTLPNPEQMEIGLGLCYFDDDDVRFGIALKEVDFKVLKISDEPLSVEFVTEGSKGEGSERIRWKIRFVAQYFGDPWPIYRHYTGPYYVAPKN